MDEDWKGFICCLAIGFAIVLSIVNCVLIFHRQSIELEKYKIEIQQKYGDFVLEEE